jgi:hypothetical protein
MAAAAAFDPLAELKDSERAQVEHSEKTEVLRKKRNSARVNAYLFLALAVVFGAIALVPVTYGDLSVNPHDGVVEADIQRLNDDTSLPTWSDANKDLFSDKIWDGNDPGAGYIQRDLGFIPGIPVQMGGITDIPIELTLVTERSDGGNLTFRVGFFPYACDKARMVRWTDIPPDYQAHETFIALDTPVTLNFKITPGQYCLIFTFDEPVDCDTPTCYKSTIDAEMDVYWPGKLTPPFFLLFFILTLFAFIGARRRGKAYKALTQPEGPDKKSTEEEVLEAAEAERAVGLDAEPRPDEAGAATSDRQSEEAPSTQDYSTAAGGFGADEVAAQTESSDVTATAPSGAPSTGPGQPSTQTQPATSAAAGATAEGQWTTEQIAAWKAQQGQPQAAAGGQQAKWTPEQVTAWGRSQGWSDEQIAKYQAQYDAMP